MVERRGRRPRAGAVGFRAIQRRQESEGGLVDSPALPPPQAQGVTSASPDRFIRPLYFAEYPLYTLHFAAKMRQVLGRILDIDHYPTSAVPVA